MAMEIQIKNSQQDTYFIDVSDWSYKNFAESHRVGEASLVTTYRTPINMFDIVSFISGDDVKFRGYVTGIKSKRDEKTAISITSIENWLNQRHIPRWVWVAENDQETGDTGDWLDYILTHEPPPQVNPENGISGYCPGILWLAQSNVPEKPADFYYVEAPTDGNPSYNTFVGYGTNSRLGTRDIYVECQKYTEIANKTEFNDWRQFWRDKNNLYIASGFLTGAAHAILLADMAFDAGFRLRDLDNGTSKISAPLKTKYTPAWDLFYKLCNTFRLTVSVHPDIDGNNYIDVLESPGRGYPSGLFKLYLSDVTYEPLNPSKQKVSALIGLGVGDPAVQQRYTAMDLDYKGLWIEELVTVGDGFADDDGDMPVDIEAQFTTRNADDGFKIELKEDESPDAGDFLEIIDEIDRREVMQVYSVSQQNGGQVSAEIGRADLDLIEAFHPENEIEDVYLDESPFNITNPGSSSGDITIGDNDTACTPRTVTGTITDRVKDYNYRVLLSYSYDSGYAPILSRTWVDVNGSRPVPYGDARRGYMLNDPVVDMDITDHCKCDGTTETIKIYVQIYGLFPGANPTVSISSTVQPVGRRKMVS